MNHCYKNTCTLSVNAAKISIHDPILFSRFYFKIFVKPDGQSKNGSKGTAYIRLSFNLIEKNSLFHNLHNGTTDKFFHCVTIDPSLLQTFPPNPGFPQYIHSPRSITEFWRMIQSSDFTPKYGSPEVRTAEAYEDLRRSWRCPPKISRYHPTPPLLSHLWRLSTLSITYHPPKPA